MWLLLFAYLYWLRGCDAALDQMSQNPNDLGGGAGGLQQAPPFLDPPLATGSDGGLVKNACPASGCDLSQPGQIDSTVAGDPNSVTLQTADPVGFPRNTDTPTPELATLTRGLELGETRPTPAPTSGQCGPYSVMGNNYTNMCTTKDPGANCTEGASEPSCKCSTGWTGQYCNAADPSATTTKVPGRCEMITIKGYFYTSQCVTKSYDNTCNKDETMPFCTCAPAWTGKFCDIAVATTTTPPTDTSTTTAATTAACEISDTDPKVNAFLTANGTLNIKDNIQTLIDFVNGFCGTQYKADDPSVIGFVNQYGDQTIHENFPIWRYMVTGPIMTTTITTTTMENLGPCASYTADDGVTYGNRCMTKDRGAQCQMTSSGIYCTCSVQKTGTYCTVDPEAFGNLGGNSTESLIDTVNIGKTNPATLVSALPALLSFLTDDQRVQMGLSIEEMVLDATFEEKPLIPRESFTFFNDPSLGNCFTFNHFNMSDKYLARGPGPRYGLRVTLAFNVDEYAPWVEAVGVLTYIHPIGQNIYLESVKHTIQPGNSDQISMKKYTFTRLRAMFAPPCVAKKSDSFYFPGDYSVDGCLRSCYQDSVYRSCGCMDASYARKPGVDSCAFDKLACVEQMNNRRGDPYYWPECKCGLPCAEEEYRYETSRAMHLEGQVSNTTFSTTNSTSNTTQTSDITIFLNTLDVYAQVEEWAFPFSRVLGLTGGFAGVLLGASVVFVIELILLFVRVGLIGCINKDTMKMRKQEGEM